METGLNKLSSIDTEHAVLGALFSDYTAINRISELIKSDDFYKQEHQHIYQAMIDSQSKNDGFDAHTIFDVISKKHNYINDEDLKEYIYDLNNAYYTPTFIEKYASIIKEKKIMRDIYETTLQIQHDLFVGGLNTIEPILEKIESQVFDIRKNVERNKQAKQIKDVLAEVLEDINHQIECREKGEFSGASTGFQELDLKTNGLNNGHMIIVAARPAMGKTAFALNLATNASEKSNKNVLIFSLEMSTNELVKRMMSSSGELEYKKIRDGEIYTDQDWAKLTIGMEKLHNKNIFIDDTSSLNPNELRAKARKLYAEQGDIGLIIVDYLQLMTGSQKNNANRVNEVSEISRSLKILAKDLNCPVIALSQLNRSLEQRPNKRPMMSDLRESGALEQDADIIYFLYRDEVYDKETTEKGIAEVIIGKNRHGSTGTVKLQFDSEFCKFKDNESNLNDVSF